MKSEGFFTERVAPGVGVTFEAARLRHQVKSSAHEKVIIDNPHFGRMMMIDGVVQLSSADAFIYHEMMSHVPLLAHGRVERVLILGGGDGALAAEVLKHRGVRKVVQVEMDPQVVRLAREYFSELNASVFRDRRFRLVIQDGAAFVAATDERFDLVLVASSAPGAVGMPRLTESFYRNARRCLQPGGLLVAKLGIPFLRSLPFQAAVARLASVFPLVSCYLVPVPCMLGGPLAFGWASSILSPDDPGPEILAARYVASRVRTRCYTPELHRASFVLPGYIADMVNAATRPHEALEQRVAGAGRC